MKWPGLVRIIGVHHRNIPLFVTVIHDWSGLIMGILVLVHIVLHWKWIVSMTKSFFKGKKQTK